MSTISATTAPGARRPLLSRPQSTSDFVLLAATFGLVVTSCVFDATTAIEGFLLCVLAAVAVIDVRTLTVPNRLVLPATAAVLLTRTAFLTSSAPRYIVAALLTAVVLLIPHLVSSSAMGMGDVKLGLLLGLALGMPALAALIVAFLASSPVAVAQLLRGKGNVLPFGPFIAIGTLVTVVVLPLAGIGG